MGHQNLLGSIILLITFKCDVKVLAVQSTCLEMSMYACEGGFMYSGFSHLKAFFRHLSCHDYNGERAFKGVFLLIPLKISLCTQVNVFC